jgi:hypothetical protein
MRSTGTIDTVRPEAELLLRCTRTRIGSDDAGRIRSLLDRPLDWEYLLRTASRQGVMPLLQWNLNAIAPEKVPDEYLARLGDSFRVNARRNLMLTGELLKLLALFEKEGITAVAYKGPTLALSAYGNIALRQFLDLDLLLHRDDLLKARDLLVEQGYRPQFDLTPSQERAFLDSENELLCSRPGDGSVVELHWEISPKYFAFPLDAGRLWKEIEPLSLSGREVMTIRREMLLVILAAHGAKHNWERLAWICDIAEMIASSGDLHWDRVMAEARRLGSERMVLLALWLAHDMLGAALPGFILRQIEADPEIEVLGASVWEKVFSDEEYRFEVLKRSRFHLQTRERLRDRLRYSFRRATVPTPEDWQKVRLPAPLAKLYPLVRPVRLAVKHGLGLVRRMLGINAGGR